MDVRLEDAEATDRLGAALASALVTGDLVALAGDLGAGKTALARAAIQALAGDPGLDAPSPTFTLVQTYASTPPVSHLDLYRIASPGELDELGLDEALEAGVAFVEWPEKAGENLPEPALSIHLSHDGPGRMARVSGSETALARLRRSLAIAAFLDEAGWPDAQRSFLLGDASTRAYEIVRRGDGRIAILMNAPRRPDGPPIRDGKPYSQIAHLAESVTPFVAIAAALRERGFHAPEIHAADLGSGLVLLEHLGAEGFLSADGRPVAERYESAARLLAHLHAGEWPSELPAGQGVSHRMPPYDRQAMLIEVELLIDWYMPYANGRPVSPDERAAYVSAWNKVIDRLEGAEKGLVLRDYHSPNLIWRGDRSGDDRLGVIDFQDALIGPLAYDVASLGQDARVTIDPELEAAVRSAYVAEREAQGSFDRAAFDEAYAIMAAQRNSKILGIFVRLHERDGKPAYLKHLPRIRAYLRRSLAHPALAPLVPIYRKAGILDEEIRVSAAPRNAMVLAAGLGKRMRPITDTIPKPLVRVAGRALIDWGLDSLVAAGVETAIVNVHHLAPVLQRHLENRERPRIVISDESGRLLDSAGGIVQALPLLGTEPFFVLNADTFWIDAGESSLRRLALAWNPRAMDILLMLATPDQATGHTGGSDFVMAPDGSLARAGAASGFIYAGAAIVDPQIFTGAAAEPHSLNRYFDMAISRGRLHGMAMDGRWITVGTPDAIAPAEAVVAAASARRVS